MDKKKEYKFLSLYDSDFKRQFKIIAFLFSRSHRRSSKKHLDNLANKKIKLGMQN